MLGKGTIIPGYFTRLFRIAQQSQASVPISRTRSTNARTALQAESDGRLLLPLYAYLLSWFFVYCYPIARISKFLEDRYAVR